MLKTKTTTKKKNPKTRITNKKQQKNPTNSRPVSSSLVKHKNENSVRDQAVVAAEKNH